MTQPEKLSLGSLGDKPGLECLFEPVFPDTGNMRVGGGMFGEIVRLGIPEKAVAPVPLTAVMRDQGSAR